MSGVTLKQFFSLAVLWCKFYIQT